MKANTRQEHYWGLLLSDLTLRPLSHDFFKAAMKLVVHLEIILWWLLLGHCGTSLSGRSLMGISWHLSASSAAAPFTVQWANEGATQTGTTLMPSASEQFACHGREPQHNGETNLPTSSVLLCTWLHHKAAACGLPVFTALERLSVEATGVHLGKTEPSAWMAHTCLLLWTTSLAKAAGSSAAPSPEKEHTGLAQTQHHTALLWDHLPLPAGLQYSKANARVLLEISYQDKRDLNC